MVRQPERQCVPVEVEPVRLYRESRETVRRRRDERRQRRRAKVVSRRCHGGAKRPTGRRSLRDFLNQRGLWRVSRR